MKVSLNWIKDYVKLPSDLELSRIAHDLTMSTVEVEGMTDLGKKFDNIVVGEILEILPHPNADKLKICSTDIGGGKIRKIVCGGINVKKGMKVAVACPGAKVCWHGAGELVIKNTAVRGVESFGMICASSEIGLFDLFPTTSEATILDLSEFPAKAGTKLSDALDLNDIILEIDNKSLTNRPDLWGHYGIARELAALYNLPLKNIPKLCMPSVPEYKIVIEDSFLCPRYIAVKIEGIEVKSSPYKLQSRIFSVGMRPLNAIVDITNYVMLATGQPAHAFDADYVKGHIVVRRAKSSEKIVLLNKKEQVLSNDDLVIADAQSPIALAGIMGGEKDSVHSKTKNIILEIANFEPKSVRRTAVRHDSRTEAGARFEKGIDTQRCDIALSVAMKLFADIFKKFSITAFSDRYPKPCAQKEIDVSLKWLTKRLGKNIPKNVILSKLKRLGFLVEFNKDIMRVTVPTWRSTGDVSIPNDIMEEVARIYGFENFEPAPITTSFVGAIQQPAVEIDRKIREYLAYRCGMFEIFTYPWVKEEHIKALSLNVNDMLTLSAPPSPEERYLRSSLVPNICKAAADNLRYFTEFSIFESAQVFFNKDFSKVYDALESLPLQRKNVAGAYVASSDKLDWLFRTAKGVVENLPRCVHAEPLTFKRLEKPVWADDVAWLNVCCNNKRVGDIALLCKKTALAFGIKNNAVVLFDLDIDSLKPLTSRTNKFIKLLEYPITERDISLIVNLAVKWEDIIKVLNGEEFSALLRSVIFAGEYKGRQIPEGKKSVTLKLIIGSDKKTLTSAEIENFVSAAMERLKKTLGAEIRV